MGILSPGSTRELGSTFVELVPRKPRHGHLHVRLVLAEACNYLVLGHSTKSRRVLAHPLRALLYRSDDPHLRSVERKQKLQSRPRRQQMVSKYSAPGQV